MIIGKISLRVYVLKMPNRETGSDNNEKIHDIINQFNNVRKYLFDEKRKLYVHAYDED